MSFCQFFFKTKGLVAKLYHYTDEQSVDWTKGHVR